MKNWGGHFTPELGGQFKLELGGQYHRNMHRWYLNVRGWSKNQPLAYKDATIFLMFVGIYLITSWKN